MEYVSNTSEEKKKLLAAIGAGKFEDLISGIPESALFTPPQSGLLKKGLSEMETISHLSSLADRNKTAENFSCFLGAGAYNHFIPSAVNAIISRGEFLTAYTPYQPEASQGTLQATFEFQTMISELYGMDVANASLYDGASALAEAVLLSVRETGRKKILLSGTLHPEYRDVVRTYCKSFEVLEIPCKLGVTSIGDLEKMLDENVACVVVQNPNFFGILEEGDKIGEMARKTQALFIVSANPISMGILSPPGDYGADIAVGEGQPLGIPLNYGGPNLGLFSCKEKHLRKMPGRLCGITKDAEGKRGFVLTLQTREQHIRREKATSNICTNEALMSLAATVYLSLLGPQGLKELALLNLNRAHYAFDRITKIPGYVPAFSGSFFNEFTVRCKVSPLKIRERLLENKIIGGLPLESRFPQHSDCMLFCVTEMNSKEQIDFLVEKLMEIQ